MFLHQKCFNVNSSGHKEPQFSTTSCLLPIVMIVSQFQGAQTWLWTCGTEKKTYARILGTPLFQILNPPLSPLFFFWGHREEGLGTRLAMRVVLASMSKI